MITILVVVVLVQSLIFVVNAVGATQINELLWYLSMRLPLSSGKDAREQLRLRAEVLKLKKEMKAISAQDDFARWAKIRREHDKALAAHDKKAGDVNAHRSSFDTKANLARWAFTGGLQMFLNFWHAKTPVFTYPRGWMPWPVEYLLAFPRCPYGAVSINVWSMACGSVIALFAGPVLEMAIGQPQAASKTSHKIPMMTEKKEL